MKYEKIFEKGKYALILRNENLDEYAVVYGLNEKTGEWSHTVGYWNFGTHFGLLKIEALQKAIECFRNRTEINYIHRNRLEELATKLVDGLMQDDKESAMEYFKEECEMEEYEMGFFGIKEVGNEVL